MDRQHFLPQMWEANVARLRRSDPDLFECGPAEPR
jgi:hypothetical protein